MPSETFEELVALAKEAAAALIAHDVRFVVAGGLASWALGGPPTETKDVDLLIRPEDKDRALEALATAGFAPDDPPEQWLVKAHRDGHFVDLIFEPSSGRVDDALLDRAQRRSVEAMELPVLAPNDLLLSKVLSLNEHYADFESVLEVARSLREQIDWCGIEDVLRDDAFGAAFLTLVDRLGIRPE